MKELLEALCKAQAEYPEIPKTRKGQIQNRSFMYADLADIHKAIKPINLKYGLAISHSSTDNHLVSTVYHAASGQSLSTQLPLHLTEQLKETGAALTYLKRYNIQNLLDISTDEDIDAIERKKMPEKTVPTKAPEVAYFDALPPESFDALPPESFDADEPLPFDEIPKVDNVDVKSQSAYEDFKTELEKHGEAEILRILKSKDPSGSEFYDSVERGFYKYKRLTPAQKTAIEKSWKRHVE